MEKGERLSFSSISVADELPASKSTQKLPLPLFCTRYSELRLLELSSREERDQAE